MAWNITLFFDDFSREMLAYLKYFDEICIKVVHTLI